MTSELRVVLDTSVIVSAVLLPRSVPRQAFDRVQDTGKVLISEETVDELAVSPQMFLRTAEEEV